MAPRIRELAIRNVRCFNTTQSARLNRITLLVGDNNVGKSTFMGIYNAFAQLSNLDDLSLVESAFDSPPFFMGDFDSIARLPESSFTISGKFENHVYSDSEFTFKRGDKGQPLEHLVAFSYPGIKANNSHISIAVDHQRSNGTKQLSFQCPDFSFDFDWSEVSFSPVLTWLSQNVRQNYLPYNADPTVFQENLQYQATSDEIVSFQKFIEFLRFEMPFPSKGCFQVEAMEPHSIPRLHKYREPPFEFNEPQVKTFFEDLGVKLGLWDGIELNENSSNGKTEIIISTITGKHNLLNVGYGVHSLLPLVHAMATANSPKVFLLQQPEAYVHPETQAKLVQFMAETAHDFIIETHSDHIIDRLRLCVRNQVLQPEEFTIVYFEKRKKGTEVELHNISVDSMANVLDPPKSYRKFFLDETYRLLGMI